MFIEPHRFVHSDGAQQAGCAAHPVVYLMNDSLQTGGTERQFALLAHALRSDSFPVFLGCLQRRGVFLEDIEDILEFPTGGSFFNLRAQRSRVALFRHLRHQRVAIAQSFDFYSNLMLIPMARLAGVPVVIGSQRQIGDLLTPRQFAAQLSALRLCDRVTCNSQAAAARLVRHGMREHKVVVIPNALAMETFDQVQPAFARQPGVLRVGMIARMNDPAKNHAVFLRAVMRLSPKFPKVEFFLVGDGPLRPDLERLAANLGVKDRVRFLGERHDIRSILAALDISVLPSSSESLSNVILESMAAARAVVATSVGGNPELIDDGSTGLLVPVNNDVSLADALERLLIQADLRTDLGERARRVALEKFDLTRVRDEYKQLYALVLKEKGLHSQRRGFTASPNKAPRPVRVSVVAPSLRRWIGGQGVQADLLLRCWQQDSAVRASFIPIDPVLPWVLKWSERIPYLRTLVREPFYVAGLWRGTRDVDVVHVFAGSYWSFLLAPLPAWLISRMRGKKVLIHYHSGEAPRHLQHWRSAAGILKRVDRLVVPSSYLVKVFRDFGLQAHAIPNVVDWDQFHYRARRPMRAVLVCTRGFEPYYSVDLVVRAFAQVKKQFRNARLILAGKGSQENVIRHLVREMQLSDVEFPGVASRDTIGGLYEQADIFINASWLDNMPVSLLEAFASGTPVVSTAPEGIRCLVEHEHTGLLSAPGDDRALAANVMRLLRDPNLARRLAHNAFEQSQQYRWPAVRGEWLAIYESLRGVQHKSETQTRRHAIYSALTQGTPMIDTAGMRAHEKAAASSERPIAVTDQP